MNLSETQTVPGRKPYQPFATHRQTWRVVVVDDSPDDRAEVRRLLLRGSNRRFSFLEAETGASAIAMVRCELPDCVVLDFHLPDMDAPEVIQAMLAENGLTHCPIVVITGSAGIDCGRTVLRAGAQDFIGKDWLVPDGLARAVENAVERWDLAGQLLRHQNNLEAMIAERTSELEQSHRQLRLSERMASLGTLAAGLGHDMANLLMPMRMRLATLEAAVHAEAEKLDVRAIREACDYLQTLASGLKLLVLDPKTARCEETTEILRWWTSARTIMKTVLPPGVKLEEDVGTNPCVVAVRSAALTQIVFNLIQNAGDAIRAKGKGIVTVSARPAEGRLRLCVVDDGPGMSPETKARCMEPFYSTKAPGTSTGLGLVLVYSLTKEAGGTVELTSQPGEGCTFTVQLPLADSKPALDVTVRQAVLEVMDPRLRSFVEAELKSMRFEVKSVPENLQTADLFIVDNKEILPDIPLTAQVVLLSDPPSSDGHRLLSLGTRPPLSHVRTALREVCKDFF